MKIFLFIAIALIPTSAFSQPITVFEGQPIVKILNEGETSGNLEKLSPSKSGNFKCAISKVGDEYFWTSRDNTPLFLIDSGGFSTFVALTGSGYIRVIKSEFKQAASQMSETEKEFDYAEHLVLGLRSVTYYGTRTD